MKRYKVLVVDDSVFMRKIISDMISEHADFQVFGTAKNGREGVELAKKLKPDVITMDVEMPEMNGLEALKAIMSEAPAPVIMLSSLTREGAEETIQALELGAVDFVRKPSGPISLDLFKVKEMLFEKLEIAVRSNIQKNRRFPSAAAPPVPSPATPEPERKQLPSAGMPAAFAKSPGFGHMIAIGTSTGGPRALQQVLCRLPKDIPASIVVVQHMPPNFTQSLALRLDAASQIKVVEGKDGMILETGTAYIAPGGYHMTVHRNGSSGFKLRTTKEEPRRGHRPSVDTLFESLIPYKDIKRHVVLMTGMGSDGAKGMQMLKRYGAETTIAESEETCVVYGMPRSAAELGCVDYVIPVHEIADKLVNVMRK